MRRIGYSLNPVVLSLLITATAHAQSTSLYSNDFERPNEPLMSTCTAVLDQRGINRLYGTAEFQFQQTFTVEGFLLRADPTYADPGELGGEYAVGFLSTAQQDTLALIFDAGASTFLNVGFHLAPTDIVGCGGPVGFDVPIMKLSAHDAPGGVFDILDPGPAIAEGTVTGTSTDNFRVIRWTYGAVPLDISASTDGNVALVFDLLQSGYGIIDNLSVVATDRDDVFDRDTDSVPDDSDNCPDISNPGQEDRDMDTAGDPCDPAPDDPTVCGDRDEDGVDDCEPPPADAGFADTGASDGGTASDDDDFDEDGGSDDGDCSCSATGRAGTPTGWLVMVALAGAWRMARRTRSFSSRIAERCSAPDMAPRIAQEACADRSARLDMHRRSQPARS